MLHAWREWIAGVPEEVTSIGRLLQFPPFEEMPEPLRGQSFAVVEAVCLMSEAEASELLRPLRELGPGDGHLRDRAAGRASPSCTWTRRCRSPT